MYVSDWINGWSATGKGRIYTLHDPKRVKDPAIAQMKKVFAEGFARQSSAQLGKLLEHVPARPALAAMAGRKSSAPSSTSATGPATWSSSCRDSWNRNSGRVRVPEPNQQSKQIATEISEVARRSRRFRLGTPATSVISVPPPRSPCRFLV